MLLASVALAALQLVALRLVALQPIALHCPLHWLAAAGLPQPLVRMSRAFRLLPALARADLPALSCAAARVSAAAPWRPRPDQRWLDAAADRLSFDCALELPWFEVSPLDVDWRRGVRWPVRRYHSCDALLDVVQLSHVDHADWRISACTAHSVCVCVCVCFLVFFFWFFFG
jgi:hypothetical protein